MASISEWVRRVTGYRLILAERFTTQKSLALTGVTSWTGSPSTGETTGGVDTGSPIYLADK